MYFYLYIYITIRTMLHNCQFSLITNNNILLYDMLSCYDEEAELGLWPEVIS